MGTNFLEKAKSLYDSVELGISDTIMDTVTPLLGMVNNLALSF
jgi:hypothetical protein